MNLTNNHINYVEFQSTDLIKTKAFYTQSFEWEFMDYGPSYIAFSASGLAGGFEKTDRNIVNGALIVLYHSNLLQIKERIVQSGGIISKDIFTFPGGHRFHFIDPSGNELAIWSDKT